jgi:hypothetical protein
LAWAQGSERVSVLVWGQESVLVLELVSVLESGLVVPVKVVPVMV